MGLVSFKWSLVPILMLLIAAPARAIQNPGFASCLMTELGRSELTARKLAGRLDGKRFETKTGELVQIHATEGLSKTQIDFQVKSSKGEQLASGLVEVADGELRDATVFVSGATERFAIANALDGELSKQLQKSFPGQPHDYLFDSVVDYSTKRVQKLTIMSKTGEDLGTFIRSPSGIAYSPGERHALDPGLSTYLSARMDAISAKAWKDSRYQFQKALNAPDASQQGIGTGIFRALSESVGEGFPLRFEAANRETVRQLSLAMGRNPESSHAALMSAMDGTPLGRMLEKSGWRLDDVRPRPKSGTFDVRYVRAPDPITAKSFAANLDGKWIKTKTGIPLKVSAETKGDKVLISVLDAKEEMIAHGWRNIVNGELGDGGFFVKGQDHRTSVMNKLEWALQSELAAKFPDARSKFVFNPWVDYRTQKLTGIRIESRTGQDLGRFDREGDVFRYFPGPEGALDPHLSSYLRSNLEDISRKAWDDPSSQFDFAQIDMRPDHGNQGIATAVYSLYSEVVPPGTFMTVNADNRETVAHLRKAMARFKRTATSNLEKELVNSVRESKWGRILSQSGWEPVAVSPQPGLLRFEIRCARKPLK